MIALAVLIVCSTAVLCMHMHHGFELSKQKHVNTVALGELLEARIKAIEELKGRMEVLLIKNGLGR